MLCSRLASICLRIAQFVCAAIVLGLTAWFLHQHHEQSYPIPFGRTVYTIIVASLSVLASIFSIIPTKSSIASYGSDVFFMAAWLAAFGVLVDYFHNINCGSIWYWDGMTLRNQCGRWNTTQAFSFLSAVFWAASALLGMITHHRLTKRARTDATYRV